MPTYEHKTGSERTAEEHLFGPKKQHPLRPDLVEVQEGVSDNVELQDELRRSESVGVPATKTTPPSMKEALTSASEDVDGEKPSGVVALEALGLLDRGEPVDEDDDK